MDAVLHHQDVVSAVRKQGHALPVRFGSVFADATSLTSIIEERYEQLRADLDRVGNKEEWSVTAFWMDSESGDASGSSAPNHASAAKNVGARYLFARAAEVRRDDAMKARARAVADSLDRFLEGRSIARRASLTPTPRVAVRTACLLEPERVDDFRAAFDAMRRDESEVRHVLTGPWPPYSFVGRTESESGVATHGGLVALAQILTPSDSQAPRLNDRGARVDN
jgi:hypothetical protein